jgi:DNA-binding CsgD family transcriptional regulator
MTEPAKFTGRDDNMPTSHVIAVLAQGLESMRYGTHRRQPLPDHTVSMATQPGHEIASAGSQSPDASPVAAHSISVLQPDPPVREASSDRTSDKQFHPYIYARLAASASMPNPPFSTQEAPMLLLNEPHTGQVVDQSALISLYGLTRIEAALAEKLMQGKSLAAAALQLRMTPKAAGKHVKRIAMKTAYRQPEFIVRVPAVNF